MNEDTLSTNNTPDIRPDARRRERLSDLRQKDRSLNLGYSVFIRRMRIVLPLLALCIIAALFTWNIMQKEPLAVQTPADQKDQTLGRNELLNPRFESVDEKNQPYTITAERALQGDGAQSEMFLEKPMADIALNGGNWLAIQSDKGTYNQEKQTLSLHENVMLYHDTGYRLKMMTLDIDINQSLASTAAPVEGHGPAGLLNAQGLRAETKSQTVIFKGPAKIVLFDSETGLNLGNLTP
jgi:lipopolysaccharide export system protein LptC